MKIGLFSDIHGNVSGLKSVLAAIDDRGGADIIFAAGDLLLGGPGTDDVLDLLLERQVRLIRGNAEEILLDIEQAWTRNVAAGYPADARAAWMHELRPLVEWTSAQLSPHSWDLLSALPLCDSVEVNPGQKLLVCHATPTSTWPPVGHPDTPMETLRAAYGAVDAQVIACGHLHFPHVQWFDAKLLVNVGVIAPRRDRPGWCTFTMLEYKQERWSLQHVETSYDTAEESRLRSERGMPMD